MSDRRVSARGIIYKDGKLLAQRPKSTKTGEEYEFWCTMGGGMDPGESIVECLHREMIEETGIEPEIGRLLYIQQFGENDKEYTDFFFEIKNVDEYETIDLEATTHGEIETAEFGFVEPNAVNLLPVFLRNRDIAKDLAEVTPVEIVNNFERKMNVDRL